MFGNGFYETVYHPYPICTQLSACWLCVVKLAGSWLIIGSAKTIT
jgi:hypothetical protein